MNGKEAKEKPVMCKCGHTLSEHDTYDGESECLHWDHIGKFCKCEKFIEVKR